MKEIIVIKNPATEKNIYHINICLLQSKNLHSINMSGLAKGIYYLQLITDKETRMAKLVKE